MNARNLWIARAEIQHGATLLPLLCVSRDRQTDRRTLFSISEISKPCYFDLLARARAKDQSSGCLRQPLGREKMETPEFREEANSNTCRAELYHIGNIVALNRIWKTAALQERSSPISVVFWFHVYCFHSVFPQMFLLSIISKPPCLFSLEVQITVIRDSGIWGWWLAWSGAF